MAEYQARRKKEKKTETLRQSLMRTMLQSRPDFSKVTYRMIAKWQESTAYGSERKENNPGAHFFGLSDVDIEKQFKLTKQHAVEKAQKNLNNEIKRLVQASHGKK